jgi:hypothetical protein
MVHVSGGVNLLWNPACADMPPNWPCMDNSPTTSYGESPGFGGPVQLFNVANGVSSAVRLRGSGGAGTTPASAVGIFFQRRPGPLVGHVSMTAVYAHNSINGGGTPSWLVTGGYTVTATQIDAPFTVTESAPEPDGTRTYTAEPLPGLRFSNFPTSGQFPPGAAFWSFYPDDSTPERNWPGWQVPGCQYQLVCRYKPPVPGRMQVNAFVEWQRAIVRSKPAGTGCEIQHASADSGVAAVCEPQDPKLVLSCSPVPVRRGDSVNCTAGVQPTGATVSDLAWVFVDSAGHQIPGPAGITTTWGGTVVVPGMMRVSGKVNGMNLSDSLLITVSARSWPKIQLPAQNGGHGDLPAVPTSVGHLAHTHFDSLPAASLPVREIRDGPNQGWAYLAQPIDSFQVVVHVSNAWNTGSAWYNLQKYGTFYDPATGAYGVYCTKPQISQLLQSALQHEGLIPGLVSHVQLLRQWFNTNTPEATLEAAVVYPPDWGGGSAARLLLDYDIARLQSAALNDPAQRDGQPGSQVQLPLWPCKPRF